MLKLPSYYGEELGAQASAEDLVSLLCQGIKWRSPEITWRLHGHIVSRGLVETCPSLGNHLVSAYVETGFLQDAQRVFDGLMHLMDDCSCSSLVSAHAWSGNAKLAISLYHNWNKPDSAYVHRHMYVGLLKACSTLRDLESGAQIHSDLSRHGELSRDVFVGSALVDMYAKCNSFTKAKKVLEGISAPNAFSWNALIAGYVRNGRYEEALTCVSRMQLAGVVPDTATYVCALKACGAAEAKDEGKALYNEICKRTPVVENAILGNTLVDMFARWGCLEKANQVFDNLPLHDVVSWTALISGYVEHGYGEKALLCFDQMHFEGISPDSVTLLCSLKACGIVKDVNKGCEIHHEIEAKGFLEGDMALGSTLVDMYGKCRHISRAQRVFDRFGARNVVLWNALISGYADLGHHSVALICFEQMKLEGVPPDQVTYSSVLKACGFIGAAHKAFEIHANIVKKEFHEDDLVVVSNLIGLYAKCGLLDKAQQVFDKLVVRDVISWTTLIAGYSEIGDSEQALLCFEKMQAEGVAPNALTFVYISKACGDAGAIDALHDLHAEVERKGLLDMDVLLGSTFVDTYAKCGFLTKAQHVFDKLPVRDVISWNPLITGYAQLGQCHNVFQVFSKMISDGEKPDSITFVAILNACSRACLSHASQSYFESMTKGYGIPPSVKHHSCIIDLLGRAGQLSKAMNVIKNMQCDANLPIWLSVLGACETWGDKCLGEQVFENCVHLEVEDAAAYTVMSRLHANR